MCGRYWIDEGDLDTALRALNRSALREQVKRAGEILPGELVPAICRNRAKEIAAFGMEWGFHLPDGRRIINARSETAAEKKLFAESLRARRCLLPMSAYFEWEKLGGARRKYRIAPEGGGLHYLAGIYRFEGAEPVCTLLTLPAAPELTFIHPRMLLLLREGDAQAWLDGGAPARVPPLTYRCEDGQLRMEF